MLAVAGRSRRQSLVPDAPTIPKTETGDWDHVMIDARTALARLAAEHRELPLEKQVLEVVGRLPSSVPACTGKYIEKHDFEWAMALHRAGRSAEAEQGYRHILRAQPRHFDSLHMLGVIYAQRGNHAEAVRQIDVALETNRNVAAAHNNRGNALRELKRLDERWRAMIEPSPSSRTSRKPSTTEVLRLPN